MMICAFDAHGSAASANATAIAAAVLRGVATIVPPLPPWNRADEDYAAPPRRQ